MIKKETYYVVEVNKGIYLYDNYAGGYDFSDDIRHARRYLNAKNAGNIARKSGGKVMCYTITHEVIG
ncbi:TPA: hypothetical protein QFV49_001969 [Staphylococcus aureus]|uniref:hypothetical protein n=1 Tax=Staphylococcus aureus TaxID=1280 RepID=UPI001107282E|nr:hypothetical protein [Staphylococcus aureus]MDT3051580.1 hypothetical protein [Staphylococcus aureus]MUG37938.1 hypothetical protein [Staphylococcus aureus]MUG64026.1 hypothetical protein [Staphylococcus aureus]MWU88529.1 hypothetical protein [Staphylococcus aureus]NKO08389.1 hypothetical protein [Staphylococcus aureus]